MPWMETNPKQQRQHFYRDWSATVRVASRSSGLARFASASIA